MALVRTQTLLFFPLCHSVIERFSVGVSGDKCTNWDSKSFQDKKYLLDPFSAYI